MKHTFFLTLISALLLVSCKKDEDSNIEKYYQGEWLVNIPAVDTTISMNVNTNGNYSYTLDLDGTENQLEGAVNENGELSGTIEVSGFQAGTITGNLNQQGTGNGTYVILGQQINWSAQKK